jgi:hypothetical protein
MPRAFADAQDRGIEKPPLTVILKPPHEGPHLKDLNG